MSQARLGQQAQTAVLKEAMNVQEMQGEGVARLLSSAADAAAPQQLRDPVMGQNVDLLA